jgi:hypothetical protein
VVASEVVALGNRASLRSRFDLTRIARVLPGLETKHGYARRARNRTPTAVPTLSGIDGENRGNHAIIAGQLDVSPLLVVSRITS